MKPNYTNGPWIDHHGQIYPEKTGKTIAVIPYYDKQIKEHTANARLIAEAPALLAAAKLTIERLQENISKEAWKSIGQLGMLRPLYAELEQAIYAATNEG